MTVSADFDHQLPADGATRAPEHLMHEGLTRRQVVTRSATALAGASGLAALVSACGGTATSAKASNVTGTVQMLTWEGYDDAKALAPLKARGITVSSQYITSNDEILTKLRAGGRGTVDVVSPGIQAVPPLIEAGLIIPLDYSRLPAARAYFPAFEHVPWNKSGGKIYTAPLVWADYPLNYVVKRVKPAELPHSWLDLKSSLYRDRLTTVDDPANLWILCHARTGSSNFATATKADLHTAVADFLAIRPNIVTVSSGFGDVVDLMVRGDADFCITGWRYVEVQLAQKGLRAGSYVPADGTYEWNDSLAIAAGAPDLDAAYEVVNNQISAQGNAFVAADTGSGACDSDSVPLLPAAARQLYPYGNLNAFLASNPLYVPPPTTASGSTPTLNDWISAWEEAKS